MNSTLATQKALQGQLHPFCLVCSHSNPYGLALQFDAVENGEIRARFHPTTCLEGYEGWLHGGMIATLLDGVMTNCLFACGITAVTAELRVRYRAPVQIGPELFLSARIEERRSSLFLLCGDLVQEGSVRATASGKFMKCR
jgi:acyl-coenzyme A thioesterase PaaI-like protein